ncbi:hypothetical protein NCLIV_026980 [Neospora caninum Liverpool]|uniref:Uncharacterized protein n=1 Tax=Neospora caninum (strain Liverpool) TaxID=572307 RepID=F0VGR6_NEOCL|nr:hypothetical protein NCLIV_026980 [Neospora caninum Liverpool]CBZ52910.1 hypothetical protein NCLIV_026980 [Neospora caninum Liverpool]|eukprot:XP_003882942.1 hypothetical protein NCLIV_026980 [Neospora caninum Liverpool]
MMRTGCASPAAAVGASRKREKRRKTGRKEVMASSDVEDVWLREGATARFLGSGEVDEERRREALKALAELEAEHDADDPVVAQLKKQLLEQTQPLASGANASGGSRVRGEGATRDPSVQSKGQKRKRHGDTRDTMEEIAEMDEEEERRDRLEHLRMTNPGALFSTAKEKKEKKPDVYVQSAEIRVKPNRCFGCGAAFQTRNPDKAAYVPARVLEAASLSTSSCADSSEGAADPSLRPSSLDLSDPESAAKAFASAGGDIEKVVDLAARAESVDFEAFVSAIAEAGGTDRQEVLDKLTLACDYNGEPVEDEEPERVGEEELDEHGQGGRDTQVARGSEAGHGAEDPEQRRLQETPSDAEGRSAFPEDTADDMALPGARRTGAGADGENQRGGVRVETMTLSEEELGRLLGQEAVAALHDDASVEAEGRARTGAQKLVLCQRCHAMKSGKKIDEGLRVGFSHGDHLLHPDRFKRLVASLRTKRCIFLLFLDLISPELVPALPDLVRVNPVYVAVTKCDLLPGSLRRPDAPFNSSAEGFRRRCIANTNVARHYVFEMLSRAYRLKDFTVKNIFMISNKSGAGVSHLINAVGQEAIRRKRPVYVIGAANAGKSSFLNKILAKATREPESTPGPLQKPQLKGAKAAAAASSAVPGTTLDFIPLVVNGKWKVIDTPGIFLKGSYANLLTQEELQAAVPSSALHLCSARVAEGHGVWLGGLARVELLGDRGCFFSFFLSRSLLIRPFTAAGTPEGKLEAQRSRLSPPFSPERRKALSPLVPEDFYIAGKGWQEAAADIVLSGLGWISITGCGPLRVRVHVPDEVRVYQRPALVPRATRACPAVATTLLQKTADRQAVHKMQSQAHRSPRGDPERRHHMKSDISYQCPTDFEDRDNTANEFMQ